MKKILSVLMMLNVLIAGCFMCTAVPVYAAASSASKASPVFYALGGSASQDAANTPVKLPLSETSPRLSASKLALDIGVSKTLKLKNARGKVKWSSSNKKVAVVNNRRGRFGSVVTIKTKKHGKCTVTAVSGKKKYSCTVSVSTIKIKPISSSSVESSGAYKYKKDLGVAGGKKFAVAASDFGFGLLARVAESDGMQGSAAAGGRNVLVSPASVLSAMTMTGNGARGSTLAEMEKEMYGGIESAKFNAYLAGLNGRLCGSGNPVWQQANSLWIRKNLVKVRKSFLKKNKEYHNAQVYYAPFNAKTVKDINNWVYNNSRNMINSIIDRLDPLDRMVIVNTTAFEGQWEEPFGNARKDSFTTADGTKNKVRMLSDTGSCRYLQLNGGRGFARYYRSSSRNRSVAFVGILPPEGTDVADYAGKITGADWVKAWNSSEYRQLQIKLPEFSYDYSATLKAPLASLGIKEAFTADADFSGMASGPEKLHIDDVLHKTHIELDKNGTKAAAATAVVMKANSALIKEPEELFLDRPFLYAIVDTKTGIPLFAGIVYKP